MRRFSAVAIVLFVLCSPYSVSQSTSTLTLKRSTLGSGGGKTSAGVYTVNGTVSQSAIGQARSTEHANGVGLWYTFLDRVATSARLLPTPSAIMSLGQNYPNPFSQSTTIPYTLRSDGVYTLTLCAIDGRVTAQLKESNHTPGDYKVRFHPQGLKPGVYFVRLSNERTALQRMIVFIGN